MFNNKKFLIGGIIIALAIAYLGYTGFENSATYYLTVNELMERKDTLGSENVRVNGHVETGSMIQDNKERILRFTVVDVNGGDKLPVVYRGLVPDTFKDDIEVVIEGNLDAAGVFQANNILTKCPSKYVPEE